MAALQPICADRGSLRGWWTLGLAAGGPWVRAEDTLRIGDA